MSRLSKMLLVALLPALGVLPAVAANTHVPTPSTWTLNLKASDFGGGPVMKSDVETVTVDTDKWLAWSDVTVDDKGKTLRTSWSGPADGTMHPVKGFPGASGSWTAATDSGHSVMPDGSTMDQTLSMPDAKTIVFKATMKDKAGHAYVQKLVYERTK